MLNSVVPVGSQCPQWAGPLSPQVLAALLVLTAVAELALAFVDAEQGAVPAVQYTNPSLYIATWVRLSRERAVCHQGQGETAAPSTTRLS